MSDPFTAKYYNPRTGNFSTGAAAREGRIKTLGGVGQIISDTVIKTLIANADKTLAANKVSK